MTSEKKAVFDNLPLELKAQVHKKLDVDQTVKWLQVNRQLRKISLSQALFDVKVDEIVVYIYFNWRRALHVEEPRFFLKKHQNSAKKMFDGDHWRSLFKKIRFTRNFIVKVLSIAETTRPIIDIRSFSIRETFKNFLFSDNLTVHADSISLLKVIYEDFYVVAPENVLLKLSNSVNEGEFRGKLFREQTCEKLSIHDAQSALVILSVPIEAKKVEIDFLGDGIAEVAEEREIIHSLLQYGVASPKTQSVIFKGKNLGVHSGECKELLKSITEKEKITDIEEILRFVEKISSYPIDRYTLEYVDHSNGPNTIFWECYSRRVDDRKKITVFFAYFSAFPKIYLEQEFFD
ncbi:unnamed protein product, partial [Mesorhabditis belari]|uniref:F-box domain-containing protein n=1 Tax=Mesorhabditis belari TaxID=2138241 RepID=A0AAF3EH74_9BILA